MDTKFRLEQLRRLLRRLAYEAEPSRMSEAELDAALATWEREHPDLFRRAVAALQEEEVARESNFGAA